MILLIDNYDSFSYNLFQLIGNINPDIQVSRNDKITIEEISDLNPECIILSPGPGKPENAGICIDIVKEFHDRIPILGVCLGHQAICAAFGGEIVIDLGGGGDDEIVHHLNVDGLCAGVRQSDLLLSRFVRVCLL